ncbi:MAG TPA: hypothetical protein IAC98_05990 [Candidatus Cryptobacteroides pullicola]|nr:hypothetical protein [Candidatus Cryptobacteroides pullicola]
MKKSLILTSVLAVLALSACEKTPAPEGFATPKDGEEVDVPFYGATLTYVLETNCRWQISAMSDLDVTPISGQAGTTDLKVVVSGNLTDEEKTEYFTVTLTNDDGATAEFTVEFKVPAPSLNYGGVDYKVAYMPDGNYWMAENLRYVPEGMSISSDPSDGSGLWYPYEVEEKAATALTDDASVAEYGLLYTPAVAFGEEVDDTNYKNLEGARGICPEGWHIPSRSEWFALVGESNKADGEDSKPENDTNAPFFDAEAGYATVVKADSYGFNFTFAGSVIGGKYNTVTVDETKAPDHEEWYGANAMNYVLASTGYTGSKPQMFSLMSSFTKTFPEGKLSVAYTNLDNGVQVRCVLDRQ